MIPSAKIFAGRGTKALAERIAEAYGQPLGEVAITEFSDGEFQPSFEETVRGGRVFLVQSTNPPAENLLELLQMIDAAKRASAKHITAVIPYFGLARQDRKDKPRVPIGAKLVANLLTAAGATRIMTMDLHADQIQGFFEVPVDHLFSSSLFLPDIEALKLDNLTIASPDMGGSKRANAYGNQLGAEVVICYKQRKKANVIDKMTVIGDVKDRNIVLLDDMVDTAGTLTKAADMLLEKGAKSVRAYCTHGVLSGNAIERIENSALEELVITDTLPGSRESDKIRVLSVAEIFASVMKKVHHHESISGHFVM
ncbi:MAG: ribose-phosphate pyrophosphokinase [Bacteroidetes bacterium]|uniref:Ribose-phosphate pyrophosphokinase n=1 Tax=Phaeocystidibacter marisrubri TaxID=1577780 RepID=A0A6L3ZEZ1_9FLAO|nr:ribose-phosphate pyrophosphokinase [Phaeocystidibacter marisrubri]KAB2816168.1 ribose-phosphate pyrophosphokinase [Phaeocystidibacter marisrubri]TNE26313.1 MAG: ribose-phosphate pyrophosphokinase [Bacteroidota bacterium]GGH67666.1 ribose-phosphate pyrophosphokinase [Phaeocystidibacter marisrubri]